MKLTEPGVALKTVPSEDAIPNSLERGKDMEITNDDNAKMSRITERKCRRRNKLPSQRRLGRISSLIACRMREAFAPVPCHDHNAASTS